MCHNGEKQQCRTATTIDMNQRVGSDVTTFLKKKKSLLEIKKLKFGCVCVLGG